MSKARTLAGVVSTGAILADGTVNAAEIGSLTLPTGGDIVGTTSTQTIAGKTIAFADNTLTGVQAALVSGTSIKTVNSGSLLGSGDVAVQPTLVSGTNVKTVNSTSLLGSGDVAVQPTLVSGTNVKTVNSTSLLGSGDIAVQPTLVSGTSIKTVNSTSLLGSGDVALQPTLVSGTNIKTVSGQSILGSGDLTVPGANLQEFTTSGTWVRPSGAQFVMVELWGGGGGGGNGFSSSAGSNRGGGSGGGGGARVRQMWIGSIPATMSVTVGAGGAGGEASGNKTGNFGGTSQFGYINSFGGGYGFYGDTTVRAGGGGGGAASAGQSGSSVNTGGQPSSTSLGGSTRASNIGSGGGAGTQGEVGNSESGGAGGGVGSAGAEGTPGGSSIFAGSGGGGGSGISSGNISQGSGAGGRIGRYSTGGGTAGAVQSAGNFGMPGLTSAGGAGGGAYGTATFAQARFGGMYYGNGTFAQVTQQGYILTSSSGTTSWTPQTCSFGPMTNATHDGSKFILSSIGGEAVVTTTDFLTYTRISSLPYTPNVIARLKFVNGKYFAIRAADGVWSSDDLINWRLVYSGGNPTDICWTGVNYVISSTNTPMVVYSPNLTTWTVVAGLSGGSGWSCESNGSGVVVVQSSATPFAIRSINHGVTFSPVSTTLASASDQRSLAYLNSTWLLAASTSLWTSTDGDSWTNRLSGVTNMSGGFAFNGTTFALGISQFNSPAVRTSTPGALGTWTDRAFSSTTFQAKAGGEGGFPAGGGGGGGASLEENLSGAGGNGGNGLVRVYAW